MNHVQKPKIEESPKKRITALLLALFTMASGLQWWYVGNWRWGLVQSLFFVGWIFSGLNSQSYAFFAIPGSLVILMPSMLISLASIIMILTGSFKDNKGRYLISWQK